MKLCLRFACLLALQWGQVLCANLGTGSFGAASFLHAASKDDPLEVTRNAASSTAGATSDAAEGAAGAARGAGSKSFDMAGRVWHEKINWRPWIFSISCAFTFGPFVVAVFMGARAMSWVTTMTKSTYIGSLFLVHRNKEFAHDFQLALRGAVFALITALPFFFPQLAFLWETGRYGASALVMFVFTLYKSVGETVNFAFVGVAGTFLAVLNVWVMFGIFPGGVDHNTPDSVWYAGVIDALLFSFLILFLNFDNSLRMFALSWHVYFLMTFLNPNENSFNSAFSFRQRGPAVSALLMSGIGAGMAIIASLVPYPLFALDKARASAYHVSHHLSNAWTTGIECFGGCVKNHMQEAKLTHILDSLTKDSDALDAHLGNAWWECLGRGKGQKVREYLKELDHNLHESFHRLRAIQFALQSLPYSVEHEKRVASLMGPLKELAHETGELMKKAVVAANDGVIDPEERDDVKKRQKSVSDKIKILTKAFAPTSVGLDESTLALSVFCMSYCTYGRLAESFVDSLLEISSAKRVIDNPSLLSIFDRSVLLSKDHLNFVVRNGMSLLLAFVIGYRGYSEILHGYNSGPSGTVALLLSSFVGAAIVKNLGRLQGAVLGTCLGQIAYAVLAWCTVTGYISVALFVFLWLLLTLFTYYNSPTYGYIGCLLAAFGAQSVLQGCSDTVFNPGGTYYMIINTVIGILCMTICDLALAPARASDLANAQLLEAWRLYRTAVENLFQPSIKNVRFHHGNIKNCITAADSFGEQADMEPRWWRTPFQATTFSLVAACVHTLREHLCNMEISASVDQQDGSEKAPFLKDVMDLPSFNIVLQDILARTATLQKLFGVFVHETQDEFILEDAKNLHKTENQFLSETRIAEFIKEAKKKFTAEQTNFDSLEDCKACRLSLFLLSLKAGVIEMAAIKQVLFAA